MSRRDIENALITGFTAGLLAWGVLAYLQKSLPFGFASAWLVLVIPMLWIAGVQFGYVLGRWFGFFNQFGKYVAIGFTNFAVDAGVFNLLLSITHTAEGPLLVVQKAISFIVAVTHSYFWNRRWAFGRAPTGASGSQSMRAEFIKFMAVNLIALVFNVSTVYAVVHFGPRPLTATPEVWANVGAIAGSAVALIFSFIGFRLIVFKRA